MKMNLPTDVSLILTYRCQMRCKMCSIWQFPTDAKKEFTAKDLEKLPSTLNVCNITGGEPLQREDLGEIIEVMLKKAKRIVISTSGWHYDKIIALAKKYPTVGYRVSIEGLSEKNDYLRGKKGGFDRGLKLLLELVEMGIKDIGFGITVSDKNADDLLWLYKLSKRMNLEFSTATFHNSYYFHKDDNIVQDEDHVIANFKLLIKELLKEKSPKSWYRAFFNLGLINYIKGGKRMLPCQAGEANFFIEPYGEVYPCNGLEDKIWKESMGNIYDYEKFEDLWFSTQAQRVRDLVKVCPKNCWMVGTAAPMMKKYIQHPTSWVVKNKIKSVLGKEICLDNIPYYNVGQDNRQGDLDYTRMTPFTDTKGIKPDPSLPLIRD